MARDGIAQGERLYMGEMNFSTDKNEVNPAKLFVGNLSWKVRDNDLRELFSQYGEVVKAEVIMERFNPNRSRGIAFVEFADVESAEKAIEALNETEFFERKLMVNVSQPPAKREFRHGGNDRRGGGGYGGGYRNDRNDRYGSY